MQIVIDIPEEDYKQGTLGLYFGCYSMKLHDTILNGTPLPDNATNGDIIKAMFPNGKYSKYFADVEMKTVENDTRFKSVFDRDWWNALYQKGGKG